MSRPCQVLRPRLLFFRFAFAGLFQCPWGANRLVFFYAHSRCMGRSWMVERLTLGTRSDRLTDDLLRDSSEVDSIELDSRVGTVVAFSP